VLQSADKGKAGLDDETESLRLGSNSNLNLTELLKERARCIAEVKSFCFVIKETLIEVYGIQQLVRSRVNQELLENFVTALVLEGPIYILLYGLIALSEYDQLQKLGIIVQNAQVDLANLQVSAVFQMSEEFKAAVLSSQETDKNPKSAAIPNQTHASCAVLPYHMTISHLWMLQWEQSPIAKIDLVYQALKYTLASEVDTFWEDTERFLSHGERNIDIDNLQGIAIYIVWALKQPSLLVDCLITSEFLSKGTKLSTRTLFLNVLKNSIEFLLDIQVDQNP